MPLSIMPRKELFSLRTSETTTQKIELALVWEEIKIDYWCENMLKGKKYNSLQSRKPSRRGTLESWEMI